MSACFDLILVFPSVVDFAKDLTEIFNMLAFTVSKCSTIDDWNWENLKEIDWQRDACHALQDGKIIVLNIYTLHFPDAGLYIERYQDQYIYSFWLSADRYPELDCAEVNDSNKYFYDNVYTAVSDICRRFELPYDWLIAGVESVFQYSEDYRRMVTTAHNITAFSSRYIDEELGLFLKKEGYKVRRVEPIESDAFEIFEKTGA